jgi:RHS repeat-associated protein
MSRLTFTALIQNTLTLNAGIVSRCCGSLLLMALVVCSVAAQNFPTAQFTQGEKGTNTMTFQVPLGAMPGRGVSLPLNLNYNSRVWRLGFIKRIYWTSGGYNSLAEAIYSEYATAGWSTSLDIPVVEWPKDNDVYMYDGKERSTGTFYPYTFRVARVYIHMPDGSTHELRKQDVVQQDYGSPDMTGTFYAVDGTRMRYDASGAGYGVLYLSDGTRYNMTPSTTQYIDRNGNTLTYTVSSRQWSDTMGRTIGMPWPANPQANVDYQYQVPGFGTASTTYVLKFQQLSATLTSGSPALQPVGDFYLPNPSQPATDYNGSNYPAANNPAAASYATMFHSGFSDPDEMDMRCYTQIIGRGQAGNTNFDPVVLSEVVLPNGQSYKFSYNNFGELDQVIYPSGAYQRYQYGVVPAVGDPAVPYPQASRGLWNRWLSANGSGTDEAHWAYGFEAPFVITVTAPGPSGTASGLTTKTYLYNGANPHNSFGYTDVLNGLPYEERIYSPSSEGGALLHRTLTQWDRSSVTYNRPTPGTGTYTAYRNVRPVKTVELWLDTGGDALAKTTTLTYDTTYQFDVGLDRTSSSEYGFTTVDQSTAATGGIGSMPQGPFFQTTTTTYLTSDNNYRSRNILGLPTSSVVSDANGTVAQGTITYDESSYSLLSYGSVTGWNDPSTSYRGNATTVSKWLDYPTSAWVQTHTQYDQCGSARNSWDALGRQSSVEYSVTYNYAYPTTSTSATPDPSGVYGQPTGLITTRVFDFDTGLITSITDPNGQTSNFEYNDSLNRPTKVTRPDGGWTTTTYNDDPANIYIRTQTLQHTTPSAAFLDSYQYFDKLGRSVRSFVNEGPTYLTTDTKYDLLGRVSQVSNPYRTTTPSLSSGINPANLWTVHTYDSSYPSRVMTVTTPDGAHVDNQYGYSLTTGYLGTTTTLSDQTSKSRKSISDAFGRITQVIEDPGGLAYQTNYTYDVLNNLRKVEQGSQLRYFGYDSLSRLIRVRQVEQTVNTNLSAWTDPVTGYSGGWTAAFTYDNNDNTLTRIDARNITTTFTHDQLNRVTTVRYSNDPQNTAGVDNYYDGYRSNNYTNIPNVKGHAWQSETLGEVRFSVDNFDVMGRPTIQRQQFWSNNAWSGSYQVNAGYDLSGTLVSETYPSGHSITYDADQSGRLANFSGNLGDGVSRTYASNFQYNEFGGLQQEQFGTQSALFHKQRFNVRGQLWDVRLSTVSFGSDPTSGDRGSIVNYYSNGYSQGGSGTDNNGNLLRQESYVPNGPYFQQRYSYDNLNRLTSVNEKLNGTGSDTFKQVYTYDRWGNRSVDYNESSTNVTRPTYTVDPNTNRLVAPSGYNYGYDNAGNQTNDTYTGGGQRVFDAENQMVSAYEVTGWQNYKYSGSGLRVRRIVNGGEVWQIYGIGGPLLAEYQAGSASFIPTREYGYRGGQLLMTVANGDAGRMTRFVYNLYYGALQRDPTSQELAAKINELATAGAQGQSQLLTKASDIARALFVSTTYETSPSRSDSQFVADLYYAYLHRAPDDSGLGFWAGQAAGSVQNRTAVLNAFEASSEFQTLVSTLYGSASSDNQRTEHFVNNFYLGVLGRDATATELQQQRDRLNAAAALSYATVQGEAETMGRELMAAQVTNFSVSETQFVTNLYEAFLQRGPDSGGLSFWAGQAGTNNSTARQNVLNAFATSGSFRDLAGTLYREVFWLVSDQLGSPRLVVDKSGSLAGVKRHDYLPFGEEMGGAQVALIGGRQGTNGYIADSVRQKFTGYESDGETGLNYAQARYQSCVQGRFTSVDPFGASAGVVNPQSFNRYSYVENRPTTAIDPSGMALSDIGIIQTDNPAAARYLENRSTKALMQRRNPVLPKPKPIKINPNDVPPPPPGGPVPTPSGPVDIDVGEPPPADGEPWPASIEVVQGPDKVYNGDPTVSPSGEVIDAGPNYGVGRTVDYVIRDQNKNPMGPETGVRAYETITPANDEAKKLNVDKNTGITTTNANGVIPDVLGFISPNKYVQTFLQQNPNVTAIWKQDITVSMQSPTTGRLQGVFVLHNTIRATSTGVTLTRDRLQFFPR